MEPFIGQLMLVGFNFAPRGWAFCNGQLLQIAQNSALFSLLGTTYGGDGRTTFGLPDLRGRAPVGFGQGNGLADHPHGMPFGTQTVTLNATQIPPHTHATSFTLPSADVPTTPAPTSPVAYDPAPGAAATAINTTAAGGGQPFSIVPPSIAMNYIIALVGIFPSRS